MPCADRRLPRLLRGTLMPKSYTRLWEQVIDFENLFRAFRAASRKRRCRVEPLMFNQNLEENLVVLQNELIWETYRPGPCRNFLIHTPKTRLISVPAFKDRVVHHAVTQIIGPLFERRFIADTFACRVNRGTHAAVSRLKTYSRSARRRWGRYYILKGDVAGFFPHVDQGILKKIIGRTVHDRKLMELIGKIIQSHESGERDGKGIPLGAPASPLFANVYLDPFDHYLKEVCREKYYIRYMDDFIILHKDKAYLGELLGRIENYLHDNLALNLNQKTGIFPMSHGIDFCGYRIWPTHIKPRKSTVKRAKRRLKKYAKVYQTDPGILEHAKASIQSFLGYMKQCSGYKTTISLLEKIVFKKTITILIFSFRL
jgi:retron-type reverse transcriptase